MMYPYKVRGGVATSGSTWRLVISQLLIPLVLFGVLLFGAFRYWSWQELHNADTGYAGSNPYPPGYVMPTPLYQP